ncbi:MAG: hypothetical protein QW406_05010, partial [Ignisphaera sp.]
QHYVYNITKAKELLTKAGFRIIEPIVETKAIPDEEELKKIETLINNIVDTSRRESTSSQ